MSEKPKCMHCGEKYMFHRWRSGGGACKYPKTGVRTIYRESPAGGAAAAARGDA